MTFEACAKRACTKVDIKADCFMEDLETFKINVGVVKSEEVHNELSIEPSERQVTIEDTDSMSLNRDIPTDNQTSSSVYICVCIIMCGFVILKYAYIVSCILQMSVLNSGTITPHYVSLHCSSRDHDWV